MEKMTIEMKSGDCIVLFKEDTSLVLIQWFKQLMHTRNTANMVSVIGRVHLDDNKEIKKRFVIDDVAKITFDEVANASLTVGELERTRVRHEGN